MYDVLKGGCIDRYTVDEFASTLMTLPRDEPKEWEDVRNSSWRMARPRQPYVRRYWREHEERERAFEERMRGFRTTTKAKLEVKLWGTLE